jgi:hypothetical protein
MTNQTDDKATIDVVRLVRKSGSVGLTRYQLIESSRSFRSLTEESKAALLDGLVGSGVLIVHHFPAPVRGRSRLAYLAAEISQ